MKPGDKIVKLPEDEPEVVRAMVYWMYEDTICISKEIEGRTSCYDNSDDSLALTTVSGLLVKLYVLGEKYQVRGVQNHVLDACAKHWTRAPGANSHGVNFMVCNFSEHFLSLSGHIRELCCLLNVSGVLKH